MGASVPTAAGGASETRRGLLLALAAFGFWGVVPVYFKALRHVAPLDILAHRVVWSVPFLAVLLSTVGDWPAVRALARSPRLVGMLLLSATLVAVNWLTFIYGVTTGRILETSLGYYINPLVNVVLGMIFFRERLGRLQTIAVLLAGAGTLHLTLSYGRLPWIALTVALTFGFYGVIRKTVPIAPIEGLFVETSLLFPAAAAYLALLAARGTGAFVTAGPATTALLLAAGFVTALPLIWFAGAARRLPFATVGLCQYLAPSLTFLLGVLVYDEAFTHAHAVAFGCIWTALAIFSLDLFRRRGRTPSGFAR